MVIDTSALLALIFNQKESHKIAKILDKNAASLRMSTVNLAEALIIIQDRHPHLHSTIIDEIYTYSIRFVPPTIKQATIASHARMIYPINLGDCFAYALAKDEQCPLLTLDKDFKKTDIELIDI